MIVHLVGKFTYLHDARLGGLQDIRFLVAIGIALGFLAGSLPCEFMDVGVLEGTIGICQHGLAIQGGTRFGACALRIHADAFGKGQLAGCTGWMIVPRGIVLKTVIHDVDSFCPRVEPIP